MKTVYLFPSRCRLWGLILTLFAVVLSMYSLLNDGIPFLQEIPVLAIVNSGFPFSNHPNTTFFNIVKDDFGFELISILFIIGGFFIGFSKQKIEDEFISFVRLQSLVIAIYVHFSILLVMILFFYGLDFFYVMMINMYTILWLFNIVFYFKLFKLKKQRAS